MKAKITKQTVIAILVDSFLFVVLLIMSLLKLDEYTTIFLLLTLIHLLMLFSWYRIHGDFINYFSIILLLSYIYYFGQYLLNFLGIEIKRQYTILNTYSPEIINQTAIYLEMNMVILHAAVLLFSKNINKIKNRRNNVIKKKINKNVFQFISLCLLVVSFICEVLVLIFKIRINLTMGYSAALNTSYTGAGAFSHIVNFISTLFLPALFASFVSTKGKKKLTAMVAVIYIIFLILYFLSGSRFEAVVSLAGICLFYNFYYKKIRIKTLILIIIAGIFVIYICSLLSNIRRISNYGSSSSMTEIFQEAVNDTNDNNIISDVISTAGMQVLSVTAVYDNCPKNIPYSYGEYYLFGILRIIPNITGGENILITDSIDTMFRQFLTKTYGMGSSFIIEAYYNFGYFGILMMIVYGYLISYVVNLMEDRDKQDENLILTYFIYYIASTSFFWIRSDARLLVREIVFYYFGIKILTLIIQGTFLKNKI